MPGNKDLNGAKNAKKDEFYTQLTDIEKELRHYRKHFDGKTVLCNCDDPFESNFFKYFVLNFNRLRLKKLIATCYTDSPIANKQLSLFDIIGETKENENKPYKAVVTTVYDKTGDGGIDMLDVAELFKSGENELTELNGDGDFRSEECIQLLDEADIVVTNPPFSLFREYVAVLVEHKKRYFSKTGCAADTLAGDYLKGASIRQEYLETAISWVADAEGTTIEGYMALHQNDPSAVHLWNYFRSVIDWVQAIFPKTRREMKGLPWGIMYNVHGKRTDLDPVKLEVEIERLMGDEDVTRKPGIYEYLLTGDERRLSIRQFDRRDRLAAYMQQLKKCAICNKPFEFEDMQADHIVPWSKGGKDHA